MNVAGVRDVLLARAVEQGDVEGRLLPLAERRRLTREARAQSSGDQAFLLQRSRLLGAELSARQPHLARARRSAAVFAPPAWAMLLAAFALGALLDRFGGGRSVHVLAFPVAGLLAWNLAVYLWIAWSAWRARGRSAPARGDEGEEGPSLPLLVRLCAWARDALRRSQRSSRARGWGAEGPEGRSAERGAAPGPGGLGAAILARFLEDWLRVSLPLQAARVRLGLHLGALGFALGVIASLYLRGLVLAYEASWESTFLGPEAAGGLLRIVLAPAAFVLRIEVPDAEHLAAIRDRPESAALWIHLWAVNLALLVAAPRGLLAWRSWRRARELEADLPFDWARDPYVLRLSAPERGVGVGAQVFPYSYRPSARAREGLIELLLELLGNRARVEVHPPLTYGQAPPEPEPGAAPECRVLLFNLAQSPEQEVHGRLVEALRRGVGAGGPSSVLVCIDEAPYIERMGSDVEAEQRVEERRRSWRRVVRDAGLRPVFLRLDASDPAQGLAAARGGLFPELVLEDAR